MALICYKSHVRKKHQEKRERERERVRRREFVFAREVTRMVNGRR